MTEREWLKGTDLTGMIRVAEERASLRKHRLALCGRCRILKVPTDPAFADVLPTLERFADGQAERAELDAFQLLMDTARGAIDTRMARAGEDVTRAGQEWDVACDPHRATFPCAPLVVGSDYLSARASHADLRAQNHAISVARSALTDCYFDEIRHLGLVDLSDDGLHENRELTLILRGMAADWTSRSDELSERCLRRPQSKRQVAAEAQEWADRGMDRIEEKSGRRVAAARKVQGTSTARLLHDLLGNPFRPISFDPRWRTADVLGLARGIYRERAFDRLPILGDALMDAGCNEATILTHCRDRQQHFRGCWVVDEVLGLDRGHPSPGGEPAA